MEAVYVTTAIRHEKAVLVSTRSDKAEQILPLAILQGAATWRIYLHDLIKFHDALPFMLQW